MRCFTSLLTAFSFLAMAFSGTIAFIMPQGRIAYWNNWTLLGLDKTAWGNIHIATGLLFLAAGIIHTCLNWKALLTYLGNWRRIGSRNHVPLLAALALTLFFSVGAVLEPPPLRQLFDFNARVKDAWVDSPAQRPPFGHAELKSLAELCDKQNIDLSKALSRLKEMGFRGISPEATLKQIATGSNHSPAEIYTLIRPAAAVRTKSRYSAELVLQRFEGTGIGRKSLAEICRQFSITPKRAATKLAGRNWTIRNSETIKDAADRLGVSPMEILQALLNGEKIIQQQNKPRSS